MSKVKLSAIGRMVQAEHGVVSSFPDDFFGYFGWPTVAHSGDGALVVAASGLRNAHVCPFGRTVICRSEDGGRTWTSPQVVNDSPLDDRDAGLVAAGGGRMVLTWFTTDNRQQMAARLQALDDERKAAHWRAGLARVTDAAVDRYGGAWMRHSDDGGLSWGPPTKLLVTTPHGPIRLQTGVLLFVGKHFPSMEGFWRGDGAIAVLSSSDGGREWDVVSTLPVCRETADNNYHEAHVGEVADGRLVVLIRIENAEGNPLDAAGIENFSLVQTVSDDRGHTWSPPEPLNFHGSPPHLLSHSSGALVCTYGCRQGDFGQRAMVSRDGGESWDYDLILRDDGSDGDLGYPSSVELTDGSIFTVYYQRERPGAQCALLWTRWALPD